MHIHILGIGGTFMAGVALLARAAGHRVTGSDANLYPPMSTQLESQGIAVMDGYHPAHLKPAPDCVVVGNALSRGNPAVEYMLDQGLPYTSGPQWLAEQILRDRWVIAVAGTHGKTSTASLIAWLLEAAGLGPGFLVGGMPENFGVSARLGATPFFVVEADEYDTAFFDKRSKFVHYRPRTLVLNNLEYEHADIFPDLASIQRQFHHLVRTVPSSGLIIANADEKHLAEVFGAGCWTPVEYFSAGGAADKSPLWSARHVAVDSTRFDVCLDGRVKGTVQWPLMGRHNLCNALAAIAAARHAGVAPATAIEALAQFRSVKRRMELRAEVDGVRVYDDFAHHPTAIAVTLEGLRDNVGGQRIIAILEPRSNTMRMGAHRAALPASLAAADRVCLYQPPGLDWELAAVTAQLGPRAQVFDSIASIITLVTQEARPGDQVVIMSNGSFEGIHARLIDALRERAVSTPAARGMSGQEA